MSSMSVEVICPNNNVGMFVTTGLYYDDGDNDNSVDNGDDIDVIKDTNQHIEARQNGPKRKIMEWTNHVDQTCVFISFHGERRSFEVGKSETVQSLRERVREAFMIAPDEGPAGLEVEDQKILTLTFHGSPMQLTWTLSDLGITNGMLIKAVLKTEVKPSLYIYCAFNEETVPILDKINIQNTTVSAVRGIVSRQIGLPVTVFRLSHKERDLYDGKLLWDYGINLRESLTLHVWDGWKEFLNLCIMGFTRHVIAHIPQSDDILARFYMKVAMYIAAHFGHVDLAITLLKQGIRADEPIGEHPLRQWCKHGGMHIDAHKAPVHEAAEAGSLSVLRSFVHSNVCNVLAKDGNDLTPLNLALRRKQKPCASFLLTKQWSKIGYSKKHSVHLSIYVKMKRWAERARGKVLVTYGQWKSSIKNPKRHLQITSLLGQGVQLDGFSKSLMSTMPENEYYQSVEEERKRKERLYKNPIPPPIDPDLYFKSLKSMQENLGLPKMHKFSKMLQKVTAVEPKEEEVDKKSEISEVETVIDTKEIDTKNVAFRPRSNSHGGVRLPPISDSNKNMSQSQQNISTISINDPEFRSSKKNLYSTETYKKSKETIKDSNRNIKDDRSKKIAPEAVGQFTSRSEPVGDETDRKKAVDKRKERNAQSAQLIAKAKTEGGSIPLPMVSNIGIPRPFIRARSEGLTRGTLDLYEKYRGIGSRDYAIKCLTVANGFSEKPWLQQVQQALTISKQGLKKIVNKQPHLFSPRKEGQTKHA